MKSKIIPIILTTALLLQTSIVPVMAAPELPSVPDAPDTTEQIDTPDTPEDAEYPENYVPDEEPNEAPVEEVVINDEPIEEEVVVNEVPDTPTLPGEDDEKEVYTTQNTEDTSSGGGETQDNQVGDVEIETGNADGSGSIINIGNTNAAAGPQTESGVSGVAIANEKNGSDSDNSATVLLQDTNETIQVNDADLDNSLIIDSSSGNNSASGNVGNSSIETGDANATGIIYNSVNTNIDGLIISEFNIIDDYFGDYILDFKAGCVAGCGSGIEIQNTSNGSDSDSSVYLDIITDDLTFQQNDATINNELVLTANSGNNTANKNTGGDSSIQTGDANVSGSILNFANNNFAGNVIYAAVNIFGNLTGDLIISQESLKALGFGGIALENSKNASDSTNDIDVDLVEIDQFQQFNNAEIANNIVIDATTGDNSASDNTNGDIYIETGDVKVDAQVINIANTNQIGGDWWIVMVNDAGNWFGQILGLDGAVIGDRFAASQGTSFAVGNDGSINIGNTGNGNGSTNTADLSIEDIDTTIQTNNAVINNNINLGANTGGNSTSKNTGGNNSIETGDATVMLNLINFVNNNFVGGNVFLSVVNVFGTWSGDFLTPGAVKAEGSSDDPAIGGLSSTDNNSSNNSSSENDSDNNSNNDSSNNDNSSSSSDNNQSAGGVLLSTAANSTNWTPSPSSASIGAGLDDTEPDDVLALNDTKTKINLAWLALILPALASLSYAHKKGILAAALLKLRRR